MCQIFAPDRRHVVRETNLPTRRSDYVPSIIEISTEHELLLFLMLFRRSGADRQTHR